MLRRVLGALALLLGVVLVLPPLFFALRPREAPPLPPPGRRVAVAPGLHVNLVETGSGPPVVLVHGLPGSAYDWRHTAEALAARGRRALAYDRVGYGHSDPRPDDAFTLAANAAELEGLLAAEGLRGATVVGWSYGGGTALRAAHREGSRIGRLVLVGSMGPGLRSELPALSRLLFSDPVFAWMRRVPPVTDALRAAMSEVAFSGQPRPGWWLPSLEANFARPATVAAWRAEGRRLRQDAAPAPDPDGLAIPVAVVHGDDDRLVAPEVGRALHRRAARGTLRMVEGGSHMLPVTHPEVVADAVVAVEAQASAP